MTFVKRCLMWLQVAALGLLVTSAYAQSQAKMRGDCEAEIDKAERQIDDAKKMPQYKSDKGRNALTMASRSLNAARKHAAATEWRNCTTAAQKSRSQLSQR